MVISEVEFDSRPAIRQIEDLAESRFPESTRRTMKRVLMISYAFPPMAASGVFRATRFARYLPEFGWQPTVLTIRENAIGTSHSIDDTLYRLIPIETRVERTSVLRPLDAMFGAASKVRRYLTTSSADLKRSNSAANVNEVAADGSPGNAIKSYFRAWTKRLSHVVDNSSNTEIGWFLPALCRGIALNRRENYDAIYCTGPPHSAHVIATCLRKITRKPLLLDLRDPWARTPWDLNSRRWRSRVLERWCFNAASRVVLNTKDARNEYQRAYSTSPATKFIWIPNGTDPDFLDDSDRPDTCLSSSVHSEYVFCHPGEVYGKRCILPFVRAMKVLNNQKICAQFEQVGQVANEQSVRDELARLQLRQSVVLHGHRPHKELLRLMQDASFFLIIQPHTGTQIPAKIFEMLKFRKPILALTGAGATAEIVRDFHLGIVENSDAPERIAEAAMQLIQRRDEFARSDGWERARSQYDGRALTRLLAETLDSMAAKRQSTINEIA